MKKRRQKRIAVVNDITGFGRCSVAVSQPIISAMKIQCCVLPTAILSSHTAFPNFFFDDYTSKMREYINNWSEIGVQFDGISTGFLGSKEQIDIVTEFLKDFKKENTIVMVDPVMGDNGKLYSTYTKEMCNGIQKLLAYADVLSPNLTEACRLVDLDYPSGVLSDKNLEEIAIQLSEKGPSKIVITGIQEKGKVHNFVYEKGKGSFKITAMKIGEDRSGTGDVFASIVISSLINGDSFKKAVKKATKFISKTIKYTIKVNTPIKNGLCFEEYLTKLK